MGALVLLLLCRCAAPEPADCTRTLVARLPLAVQNGLPVVPAGINGKWVRMVVDTGASRTTLSAAAAMRLGLRGDPRFVTRSLGVGGSSAAPDVAVGRLVLGGRHLQVVRRLAVGTFDLRSSGLDADGLLGADILLAFDLDIDVPAGVLTLYRSRLCPDAAPPWPTPALAIPGVRARQDKLLLPIVLDGTQGMAFLDTGAQRDLVGRALAERMGLDAQSLAGDPRVRERGTGPQASFAFLHRFRTLRVGPVEEVDPVLPVMRAEAGVGDALLGEDFLRGRRVWISFHDRAVYLSRPAGGR